MPGELTPALREKLAKLNPKQLESLAHSCKSWVEFKVDLRQCTTKYKLKWLSMYLDTDDTVLTCCSDEMREIQVLKYLKQMHHDRLIHLLPTDFNFTDRRNWTKQVTIRDNRISNG